MQCQGCEGFKSLEKQLDRVLNNQGKLFDRLDKHAQAIARQDQWRSNHEKGHDKGFSRALGITMAVAAFLAVAVSIVVAIVK